MSNGSQWNQNHTPIAGNAFQAIEIHGGAGSRKKNVLENHLFQLAPQRCFVEIRHLTALYLVTVVFADVSSNILFTTGENGCQGLAPGVKANGSTPMLWAVKLLPMSKTFVYVKTLVSGTHLVKTHYNLKFRVQALVAKDRVDTTPSAPFYIKIASKMSTHTQLFQRQKASSVC